MKNRRGWKMRKSKMLETDVFAQRYALLVVHAAIGLDRIIQ